MKTGFVAVEEMPSAELSVRDKSSAIYQIAIIAAAVLLIASAAFL
jgi:hypothetical protein